MKRLFIPFLLILQVSFVKAQTASIADSASYLSEIKKELVTQWPKNRTINLVFHGHSVPAGFWHDHEVHTLESYPYLILGKLSSQVKVIVYLVFTWATISSTAFLRVSALV